MRKILNNLRAASALFISLSLTTHGISENSIPRGIRDLDLALKIYTGLLQNNRVKNTGLFLSFPETRNRKIAQQSSLYDQAAIGLLALQMGDDETVKGLLKFFHDRWNPSGLANFYNAYSGLPGIEKIGQTGPNSWVGLFAARLALLTRDPVAFQLTLRIAHWIYQDVPHLQGGVAMSDRDEPEGTPWRSVVSTENNISYYALLQELLKLPLDKPDREMFQKELKGVESWLIQTAYRKETGTMLRGVNPRGLDPIPALDTYTWLILALGPQKLRALALDPVLIMDKAAQLFEVNLGPQKGVDSTDKAQANVIFARGQSLKLPLPARPQKNNHRLIWYEGLAHYILCLHKMYQLHPTPENEEKLRVMIRSFDMGNLYPGQMPPKYPYTSGGELYDDNLTQNSTIETSTPTLICAVWRSFVALGYNPLNDISHSTPARHWHRLRQTWKTLGIEVDQDQIVLYGTSQDMLNRAWTQFQNGHEESALNQAYAVIGEWSSWAHEQQAKKKAKVGGLIRYDGTLHCRQEIWSYWALNDVAGACFLVGQILHRRGQDREAKAAFDQIFKHYSLGQVWDPQGWFWSPAQAAYKDYIEPFPKLYGFSSSLMAAEIPDEVSISN